MSARNAFGVACFSFVLVVLVSEAESAQNADKYKEDLYVMDKEMIHLGACVEVSRKGTFVRKGYISSVLDVSDNRCVSVFYNDAHFPKSETFVFEGEGWFNHDMYQTVGYLLAPLNQIRPVQSKNEIDLLL